MKSFRFGGAEYVAAAEEQRPLGYSVINETADLEFHEFLFLLFVHSIIGGVVKLWQVCENKWASDKLFMPIGDLENFFFGYLEFPAFPRYDTRASSYRRGSRCSGTREFVPCGCGLKTELVSRASKYVTKLMGKSLLSRDGHLRGSARRFGFFDLSRGFTVGGREVKLPHR